MTISMLQKAARVRNWRILRLRGAYALMGEIGCRSGQLIIDLEIEKLGATSCANIARANREQLLKEPRT